MIIFGLFACGQSSNSDSAGQSEQNLTASEAPEPAPEYKSENMGEATAADEDAANIVTTSNQVSAEENPNTTKVASSIRVKQPDKIIKEGFMSGTLKDYAKDKAGIMDIIKKSGAYISSENEMKETYKISNELMVRIESAKFDKLVDDLEAKFENLDYKRINATDVSEEYYDLETRLKTKKEVEKRYIDFLSKAKNIKEVLQVENELRVIREEIESKEGRLHYLIDKVGYSTLTLTIYQNLDYTGSVTKRPGFFNKVAEGFQTGWKGILNFFIFLAYIWPVWIGLLILILIWRNRKTKGRWPFRKKIE